MKTPLRYAEIRRERALLLGKEHLLLREVDAGKTERSKSRRASGAIATGAAIQEQYQQGRVERMIPAALARRSMVGPSLRKRIRK